MQTLPLVERIESVDGNPIKREFFNGIGSLPPFAALWGGEADYGKAIFERANFAEMAKRLAELQGMFILSINDRSEIRDLFAAFEIEEARVRYSVSRDGGGEQAAELIISNAEAADRFL